MALDDLLTDIKPFGPTDQSRIEGVEDAVALLDLSEPLTSAISGNYTLVYGRKGCGKSSVLSVFEGFKHLRRQLAEAHIVIEDVTTRNIAVKVDTWEKFLDIETHVLRIISEMAGGVRGREFEYELIPPEVVERVWIDQIWDQIFRRLRDVAFEDAALARSIPNVLLCFDDARMARMRGTPDYIASKIFSAAREDILDLLRQGRLSIAVLFDSMERYPIRNDTFSISMSGFLRAINSLSMRHKRLRVVFALPEEMLPHFRSASSNILKDFESSFALRWTPHDLLRIVAHRYSLFLARADPDYFARTVRTINLSKSSGINRFYGSLLPDFIVNEIGKEEPTRPYIIRHTHLLPRHIIMAFNEIAQISSRDSDNWRRFTADSIVAGIKNTEEKIAWEVLQPYEVIYKGLGKSLNAVLGDLPPVFGYGQLDKALQRIPDNLWDIDKGEIMSLLFRIGILGRVSTTQTDARYLMSEFFFNFSGNIVFSGADELCFHPIFSRHFNASRHRDGDTRIVYPVGLEAEFQS